MSSTTALSPSTTTATSSQRQAPYAISNRRGLDQAPGREITPAFAAGMTEQLRNLLDQLTDDVQRRIALGKLQGKTNKQLSGELGIRLRAVERTLAMIRDKWRGDFGDE